MSRVELAPDVLEDFDRFLAHMARFKIPDAPLRIHEIVQTLELLNHSPLIGRPVAGGKLELVIGRDARGYVAQYRYVPSIDRAFVLAIRSQREEAYRRSRPD
jgi:plasmid stabilization system protein ParE